MLSVQAPDSNSWYDLIRELFAEQNFPFCERDACPSLQGSITEQEIQMLLLKFTFNFPNISEKLTTIGKITYFGLLIKVDWAC